MARTNKYSSINFNEIYDKKINPKSSSAPSATSSSTSQKTHLSNSRIHGGMLVLTRPSPKPQPQIQPQPKPSSVPSPSPSPSFPSSQIPITSSPDPDQTRFGPESISLRPLGRTGSLISSTSPSVPVNQEKEREPPLLSSFSSSLQSLKPEPFVPPHLRPGFAGRQEKFGQDGQQKNPGFRSREFGHNKQGQQVGSPNRYGSEDGRPKSGGYERVQRGGGGGGGESDQGEMNQMMDRPSSSGNRPNSSGWYGSGSSSYRSPHHF